MESLETKYNELSETFRQWAAMISAPGQTDPGQADSAMHELIAELKETQRAFHRASGHRMVGRIN